MPVLGVLCKNLNPNHYSVRRKESEQEFDKIVLELWNNTKACSCSVS